ncbi:FAD:protein FMN transferase ApbE [Idiomarina sp. OT37-5b]|jgi:thiamine biosynthesis lipoprotein|uniref:FAD:protein FMN transferase n=1 Tax=Idiomarina aquatica TaxID=1327752 RepID=A0AA94EFJ6_9GAMM|nr:FAD:protein FMN transferase [Idiomarina aquatica]AVJ55461.1 FAD:protein FMN transferase ApbE [Idiomarina sp. OT37-5b]RUO44917.1 FAD:protein FMN transferase ApbE [Idiomarina aquatica]
MMAFKPSVVAKWWLVLLGLAFLVSCSDAPKQIRFSGDTMGTTYSIALYSKDPRHTQAEIQKKVETVLAQVNAQMSTYDPDSELSRFNRHESTQPVVISRALERVIGRALAISEQTDGLLDVTVGPLVNLWGFGPQAKPEQVPTAEELEAVRDYVGYRKLRIENHQLTKAHPKVYVDLSTIAKGYGVDRVAYLLDDLEITQYLIEIGGEIRTRGGKPDGQPWRLAVEKPVSTERSIQEIVSFNEGALATSGDYRNFYEENGRRYSHIINPLTAEPIQHNLVSVSVYTDDCMSADAYATALLVMGTEQAKAFVEKHQLAALLVYKTDDGFGEWVSPAFEPLLSEQ